MYTFVSLSEQKIEKKSVINIPSENDWEQVLDLF